jgi:hypothetical protein
MKENKIVQVYEEGKVVEEYLVDNIYSTKEGVHREGVRNGFYKRYEFDKLVEEGNYQDGLKTGLWKKYHVSLYHYENDELIEEKHNVPNY